MEIQKVEEKVYAAKAGLIALGDDPIKAERLVEDLMFNMSQLLMYHLTEKIKEDPEFAKAMEEDRKNEH